MRILQSVAAASVLFLSAQAHAQSPQWVGIDITSTDLATGAMTTTSVIVEVDSANHSFSASQNIGTGGVYVDGQVLQGPTPEGLGDMSLLYGVSNFSDKNLKVQVEVEKIYDEPFQQPMLGAFVDLVDFSFDGPPESAKVSIEVDDQVVPGTTLEGAAWMSDNIYLNQGIIGGGVASVPAKNITEKLGLTFEKEMPAGEQMVLSTVFEIGSTAFCADLNGDAMVDAADLAILLGAYGRGNNALDLNQDGLIGGADLGILLGDFGSCHP